MANFVYDAIREQAAGAGIGFVAGDARLFLVDGDDYTEDQAAHVFVSDIPAIARVAMSDALTTKTVTGGNLDSDPANFSAVTGDPSENLVLAMWTGDPATSRLIAFYDTASSGLPWTPNGAGGTVTPNASGWCRI